MKKIDKLDFTKIKNFQSQDGRKYHQIAFLANDLYTKYIKNSQNSTVMILRERKLQISIPYKYTYKTLRQNMIKPNPAALFKGLYTMTKWGFIPGMQG